MKRLLLSTILFLSMASLYGQAIETSAIGGYVLSGKARYFDGEIDVKNGPVWSLSLGYDTGYGNLIQFVYSNNYTSTETINFGPSTEYHEFDLMIQHFHLGVEKSLAYDELIRPYGAIGLGLSAYSPQNSEFNSQVRFSASLGGGIKIFPTERLGFKIQGKLFLPMLFDGAGIYCSTGSGCGGGSSFRIPIVHAELAGGVVFRLEKEE